MVNKLIENLIGLKLDLNNVNEVRIRRGLPIVAVYRDKIEKIYKDKSQIIGSQDMIDKCIEIVTAKSYFAFEHKIANGHINYYGSKITMCGEGVYDGGKLCSIKNISSINIRIPREVIGCSKDVMQKINFNTPQSILIIGKTSAGKTTLLRDIAKHIKRKNVVVIDDRCELFLGDTSLGEYVDVITDIDKERAIKQSIRGLNPNVILLDEVMTRSELILIKKAVQSGISVIASFHGYNSDSYTKSSIYIKDVFQKYVLLEENSVINKIGVFENV